MEVCESLTVGWVQRAGLCLAPGEGRAAGALTCVSCLGPLQTSCDFLGKPLSLCPLARPALNGSSWPTLALGHLEDV